MKHLPPNHHRTLAALTSAAVILTFAPCGMGQTDPSQPPPSGAIPVQRLVIEYDQGDFKLLSQNSLRKVVPPSDELPAVQVPDPRVDLQNEGDNDLPAVQLPSGFWFEVMAGDGSVRYRRIMENPILLTFEGIDPDRDDGVLERVESVPEKRVFSILVPVDPAEAAETSVVFFSSPLVPGAQAQAASAIGRVGLQGEDPGPFIATLLED